MAPRDGEWNEAALVEYLLLCETISDDVWGLLVLWFLITKELAVNITTLVMMMISK